MLGICAVGSNASALQVHKAAGHTDMLGSRIRAARLYFKLCAILCICVVLNEDRVECPGVHFSALQHRGKKEMAPS
jgi:hypothetical protein